MKELLYCIKQFILDATTTFIFKTELKLSDDLFVSEEIIIRYCQK